MVGPLPFARGDGKVRRPQQVAIWTLAHTRAFDVATPLPVSRPVQWSKSSMIFTAHESSPMISARHFPTSRQFDLMPIPTLSIDDLINYEQPTVISLCPTDDWLFAYFPGINRAGMGCVWQKEAQLDRWMQRECWSYPIGGGVVTAAWACHHREVS